ncbi:unnamed protein product [Urochloa humidicola]
MCLAQYASSIQKLILWLTSVHIYIFIGLHQYGLLKILQLQYNILLSTEPLSTFLILIQYGGIDCRCDVQ